MGLLTNPLLLFQNGMPNTKTIIMQFEITVHISAPLETVWHFVTHPTIIANCVPGLEELTTIETQYLYQAKVNMLVGQQQIRCLIDAEWNSTNPPLGGVWQLNVWLPGIEKVPAHTHHLHLHNQLQLSTSSSNQTHLHCHIQLKQHGYFAGIPPQLIHTLFQKQSQTFFIHLKQTIETTPHAYIYEYPRNLQLP